MKRYGLRRKSDGALVTVRAEANHGEECNDTRFTLDTDSSYPVWLTTHSGLAEWIRTNSTPWFNADNQTPINNFYPDDLEVVEVTINAVPVSVTIPTAYELFEQKYAEREPEHWGYLQKRLDGGMKYGFWDLVEYLRTNEHPQ